MKKSILVIDDDRRFLTQLASQLEKAGYEVHKVWSIDVADMIFRTRKVDAVLIDRVFHEQAITTEMLEKLVPPDVPVILISGMSDAATVEKLKSEGKITGFWHKIDSISKLLQMLNSIFTEKPVVTVRGRIAEFYNRVFDLPQGSRDLAERDFIAYDPAVIKVYEKAREIAQEKGYRIALIGPVGIGKTHFAKILAGKGAIVVEPKDYSRVMSGGPVGFEKPESAERTYILMNPDKMPPALQFEIASWILRNKSSNFIAVINVQIPKVKMIPELLSCFAIAQFLLPPINVRSRVELDLYLEHFLRKAEKEKGVSVDLSAEAYKILTGYSWPFNLREIRDVLRVAVSFAARKGDKVLRKEHFPEHIKQHLAMPFSSNRRVFEEWVQELIGMLNLRTLTMDEILKFKEDLEYHLLKPFYREAGGNISKMKRLLQTERDLHKRKSVQRLKEEESFSEDLEEIPDEKQFPGNAKSSIN